MYAELLGEKIGEHGAAVWLVNTGWTGGPFGEGERMPIAGDTGAAARRAERRAGRRGLPHRPVFGFEVPLEVPGVDSQLLEPRSTWRDPHAYDERAEKLARMFRENFEQFDDPQIAAAGPRA